VPGCAYGAEAGGVELDVVPAAAEVRDRVGVRRTGFGEGIAVLAGTAGERVVAGTALHPVIATVSEDGVIAGEAEDRVVAVRSIDVVIARGADDAARRRGRGCRRRGGCRSGRWCWRRRTVIDHEIGGRRRADHEAGDELRRSGAIAVGVVVEVAGAGI